MIIEAPRITVEGDLVSLTAAIGWESRHDGFHPPTELWYRFPRKYQQLLSEHSDAIVLPLLPAAMFAGEDVYIKGKVSPRLMYNLREYQRVLRFWHPELFSFVAITCDAYAADTAPEHANGVLCTYSGGVDSSYTLFSHLPRSEPERSAQVTHALFIESFSFPKGDPETDQEKKAAFAKLTEQLGVQFIPVLTNAKRFHDFHNILAMYMTFSTVIGGAALALQKGMSRFYFSSDNTHDYSIYSTINHVLAPLFSSDRLDVMVHGASTTKFEKLHALSKHPETYEHLVCCWENPNGLKNCGGCVKCSLIITALDMQGLLHLYSTFPQRVDRRKVRKQVFTRGFFHFPITWIRYAAARRRWDVVFDFSCILLHSWTRETFSRLLPRGVVRYLRDPRAALYRVSYHLKRYVPAYRRIIERIKVS